MLTCNMSWLKFSIFVILVVTLKSLVNCDEDFEYEDENKEDVHGCGDQDRFCNQLFTHDHCSEKCHHKYLPKKTMQQLFGPKVTECCEGDGYTYTDQCNVSSLQFFARTLLQLLSCHPLYC
jgi:hypothetical protein